MKKLLKINLIVFCIFVISLFNINMFAASSNPYYIESYNVDMVVNKDNTIDVTEKITAFFNENKHGIYRQIPIVNEVKREDGSKVVIRAKVSNVKISEQYSQSYTDGNYSYYIGDPDKTITGEKTYILRYKYDLGVDKLKNFDELYFNIIGNEWDTTISDVNFTISMPKDFDKTKLGFSSGSYGTSGSEHIQYTVEGRNIVGKYIGTLNAYEGITLRLELSDGYFERTASLSDIMFNIHSYVIPVVCLILAYRIFKKFGKEKIVVETVEFYPPEGLNSVELAYVNSGYLRNKDVVSLLVYLASKGYVKITEFETGIFKRKTFKITKIKDYDGKKENEKIFLKDLFKNSDEIKEDDLKLIFTDTIQKIKSSISKSEFKKKIFGIFPLKQTIQIYLYIIISFLMISVRPILDISTGAMLFIVILPLIGFSIMFISMLKKNNTGVRLFLFIWGIGFGGIAWLVVIFPGILLDQNYIYSNILGWLCLIPMFAFVVNMGKRTDYGTEILGKTLGFKRFLKIAEKEQLEALVDSNPSYFYNILPYAYVLDVSNKWIKKFETIATEPPEWYDSGSAFNIFVMHHFMDSTMNKAVRSMTYYQSSHSSGGFSGGGFSGGGSGGGGGSW